MVNLEPGADEAAFSGTQARARRAAQSTLYAEEKITTFAFTGRQRHGSAYGALQFSAVIQDGRKRHRVTGWYGLSVNATSDEVAVYETVEWDRRI